MTRPTGDELVERYVTHLSPEARDFALLCDRLQPHTLPDGHFGKIKDEGPHRPSPFVSGGLTHIPLLGASGCFGQASGLCVASPFKLVFPS